MEGGRLPARRAAGSGRNRLAPPRAPAGPILRGTFACAADFSRVLIALLCVVQRGSPFDKTAAPEEEPPLSVR